MYEDENPKKVRIVFPGQRTGCLFPEKKLTKSKDCQYYDFEYKEGKFKIIEKKDEIKRAKTLCGYYILETSEAQMEDQKIEEKKENTLEKFITLLGNIQLGKFSLEDKEILRVQKKNPLKDVLSEVFNLPSFDFIRDREICRV